MRACWRPTPWPGANCLRASAQVLLSGEAYELVHDYVARSAASIDTTYMGRKKFKGIKREVDVYQILPAVSVYSFFG